VLFNFRLLVCALRSLYLREWAADSHWRGARWDPERVWAQCWRGKSPPPPGIKPRLTDLPVQSQFPCRLIYQVHICFYRVSLFRHRLDLTFTNSGIYIQQIKTEVIFLEFGIYIYIHIHIYTYTSIYKYIYIYNADPLQAWNGPEGSRKLRFPDFMATAQDGGKVVSFRHRPPLPPGNIPGTHFC